jgi:sortase (surface protein transpeptidase)
VAEQMLETGGEGDDEGVTGMVEALEKETSILQKQVDACKARVMMITCFDADTTTQVLIA